MTMKPIHIIGGGLAGSEAAWQAAEAGVPVILHEMRPVIDRVFAFEEARQAFEHMASGSHFGKICIKF